MFVIKLHGAHGILIQKFFSPHYSQRDDAWGVTFENRMRFPLAVVREVKRVIAAHAERPFLLGYRVSTACMLEVSEDAAQGIDPSGRVAPAMAAATTKPPPMFGRTILRPQTLGREPSGEIGIK
ncbi:NADH:flavin oxidoreductase/NADH oxidase domain-containing protein [Rhizobium etli 8C-3]|uniref:NADH:flavin oxidoreductase/NADH oxidase domain-containing protein n=1 Tax=Rhizobium etli 8C-3 TaxID=538025 RepID=A0A1L5P000_RHIET|nr:NADH:flavin oxidoreductase/NADH oxidase domain-containing protein [Rhizobium etli 8C-3]